MLDLYRVLDLSFILKEVANYAYSEQGKENLFSLKMLKSEEEVINANLDLKEATSLLMKKNAPKTTSFKFEEILLRASKGDILSPIEFSYVKDDILSSKRIKDFLKGCELRKEGLLGSSKESIEDTYFILKEIDVIFSEDLSVKDDASETLLSLRRNRVKLDKKYRDLANSLLSKYQTLLTEKVFTIKDGHIVLPFKSGDKNRVNGIVFASSDSGLTTYIEPSELIAVYNEIAINESLEKEEIHRLLLNLSHVIGSYSDILSKNNNLLGEIDFLLAKARFGIAKKYEVGECSSTPIIEIVDGYHPLLKAEKIVFNDFNFDNENKVVILTGPNAGGKSVALKTLAIIVILHQMGLPLPCKAAKFSFFKRVFVEIGDNQSISDNFSTFSAHIDNLARIAKHIKENDLVIIDELGSATSPKEGAAIALSYLDYLRKHKVFAFLSSHYDELKEYAYLNEGIINAMMIFDEGNYEPTYKLKMGLPGKSYGLEMAKRYHLNEEIIKNAKKYLGKKNENNISDLLYKLSNQILLNEEKTLELEKKKEELLVEQTKVSKLLERLKHKEEEITKNSEELILEEVKKAKEKIDLALKEGVSDITLPKSIKLKKEIESVLFKKELLDKETIETSKPIEGDYALISSVGLSGKILSLNGKKATILTSDGMKINVKVDELKKIDSPKEETTIKPSKKVVEVRNDISSEINIIGLRLDEALEQVEKFLDNALLRNFSSVRIIHGFGTGALKNGVYKLLKSKSYVLEIKNADRSSGGDAVTIAILR